MPKLRRHRGSRKVFAVQIVPDVLLPYESATRRDLAHALSSDHDLIVRPIGSVEMQKAVAGSPEFQSRYFQAVHFVRPIVECLVRQSGKKTFRVLEVGSGEGAKVAALAPCVSEYVGIELNADFVKSSRWRLKSSGIDNATILHTQADDIARVMSETPFDLFMLYAVVEHLTLDERERLLKTVWASMQEGSHLYIGEAPNLFSPIDYHSSRLPYFQMLPIGQRLRLMDRSKRETWKRGVALEATPELGLHRWGTGISFYDFDLGIVPIERLSNHIVHDNWDVDMLNMNPLRWHEVNLLNEFAGHPRDDYLDVRVQIPRVFARYWIDMVLAKTPPAISPCTGYPSLARPVGRPSGYDRFRNPIYGLTLKNRVAKFIAEREGSRLIVGFHKDGVGNLAFRSERGATDLIDLDLHKVRFADYWSPNCYVEVPISLVGGEGLTIELCGIRAVITAVLLI